MITLGLIGGVASGKSAVACDFQKLGAVVLNGDRIGHEVLGMPAVVEALVNRWGTDILADDKTLNRAKIAELVFADDAGNGLAFLESVTHPEIEAILQSRLDRIRQLGRSPIAVLDAAVMLKAGWDALCDRIAFVDAPVELRQKRALLRGLSLEQFRAREAAQLPVAAKKKKAHILIDNSGPPQNTFRQVEEVWHSLLQIA